MSRDLTRLPRRQVGARRGTSRTFTLALSLLAMGVLTGGNCSRARVESISAMNEGIVYAQSQRTIDAIKKLERATAIDPSNDQAFYNLALVHIESRSFERAKDALRQAITVNGEVAGYHEKLGTVYTQLEEPDWNAAKEAFEAAIAKDPELFKAYFKLAQVHEELEEPQDALQRYTECIEHGPRFVEAYAALGRLYATPRYPDLHYYDQAVQVLESGLEVAMQGTEEEARLHHLLGTVYQDQGQFDAAIREFRAALAVVETMPDALFSLGMAYAHTGDREEGRRFLKKFVDSAGENVPPHYRKAAQDRLIELGVN